MRNCTVHLNSTLPHFTQILAGLDYLKDKNFLNLKYNLNRYQFPPHIFKIELDGLSLFFDLADNCSIHESIYGQSDFYIKRMLLKVDWEKRKKLLPFGLNYQVFYKNKFLKTLFLKDPTLLKFSLRYSRPASALLNMKNSISSLEMSRASSSPAVGNNIVFRGRLWDPDSTDDPKKKEARLKMNMERINLNIALKRNFPQNFIGGVEKSDHSRTICPDLIITAREYHKRNFLKVLKSGSIGIATRGLEMSIGFRFSEYISHSLAVLTTPVDSIKLLGPLKEGVNYLTFNSTEECVKKTEHLIVNDELRTNIQKANKEYYENWLHPGVKMRRIFELIDSQ